MACALLVAEKPSISRELVAILSGGRVEREHSNSQFNAVSRFECDINGTRHTVYATSVAGHLMERDFGPQYKSWCGISGWWMGLW